MPENGWPVLGSGWKLVAYHKDGRKQEYRAASQESVYERMCSASFATFLMRRGFTSWEMVQEARHVV